jgi:hypothetical protein
MLRARATKFLADDGAVVTAEFVVVMGFFLITVFAIMEIALAIFWWQTAEVAAQAGARYAVVADPAVTSLTDASGVLITNSITDADSFTYGQSCDISQASTADPCIAFATATCTGGTSTGCDLTAFNAIVAKMQTIFTPITASNVTIQYSYVGLGFVGGPVVPAVTVTISGVSFASAVNDVLVGFFGFSGFATVATMSATFTGEDLSTANNSGVS